MNNSEDVNHQHLGLDAELIVEDGEPHYCGKDALTDQFGWFIQALLAALAFMCLILKRFCEPRRSRRPWLIWFYDTSKQGAGALVVHMANVYLASQYIISFLLDSSLGLCIIYAGIRASQFLARLKHWDAINFGEYGKPPAVHAWLTQCGLYVALMVLEKILVTLLVQLRFWDDVRHFILAPIQNPRVELALVMLIVPFFVNILMFWVTDNFLMHRSSEPIATSSVKQRQGRGRRLLQRARYRLRKAQGCRDRLPDESESEVLLSADEELIGANETDQA
ncbi:hypothetical protein B566_EDAN006701 [Ephemera danica]|nr:hypothetical protein B566_EDAN006701 [Ephemera danica]